MVAVAVVLALVAPCGDRPRASDDRPTTTAATSQTCDPCLEGEGYQYELPEGWNDITDQVLEDNPGQPTLDTASAWGDSVEAGRANVIIEVSSWTYNDLDDAVGILLRQPQRPRRRRSRSSTTARSTARRPRACS